MPNVRTEVNFAIIPEWILTADVSSHAVRLYGIIHRHADKQNRSYPGRKRLAELAKTSLATVDRALDELRKIGALQVEARKDSKRGQQSNRYILMVKPPSSHMTTPLFTEEQSPLITGEQQNESHLELDSVSNETAGDVLKAVLVKGTKYPERFKGQLAREVKLLLDEGHDFGHVTDAAKACVHKGLSPTNLPSLYVQALKLSPQDQTPYTGPGWGQRSDNGEPACEHSDPICADCRRANIARFKEMTGAIGAQP